MSSRSPDAGTLVRIESARSGTPSREEIALASQVIGKDLRLTVLSVPGIRCGACIRTIERALARLDSLQAIVRDEEERVRGGLGLEANWTRLARAWFQVGDHAKAAKCVERARTVGGKEFETALLSGRIARSEGRFDEAIESRRQAHRIYQFRAEIGEHAQIPLPLSPIDFVFINDFANR